MKPVGLEGIQCDRYIFKSEDNALIVALYMDDQIVIGEKTDRFEEFLSRYHKNLK